MSNEGLLNTNILMARIAELEYGKKEAINETIIKRIYFEETGRVYDGEIKVYHSNLSELQKGNDSGFDGSVIHFYDPEKGINQSYTIPRGTEGGEKEDWGYNLNGIYEGQVKGQYNDLTVFDQVITKKIEEDVKRYNKNNNITKEIPLIKRGFGHSLGGNHIQVLQLTTGEFSEVYALNDASPTSYQMMKVDLEFRDAVTNHFKVNYNNNDAIYSISPADLKAFAEDYYRERGKNIHHLTSEEDMLYAISGIRGFINLGTREIYDTDPNFEGIGEMVSRLSDEDLRDLQIFMAQFAPAYEEGGVDGLLRAMTGYDKSFELLLDDMKSDWEKFKDSPKWIKLDGVSLSLPSYLGGGEIPVYWPNVPHELFGFLGDFAGRLGEMAAKIKTLMEILPTALRIANSLLSVVGEEILKEVTATVDHLKNIAKIIKNVSDSVFSVDGSINPAKMLVAAMNLMNAGKAISAEWDGVLESVERMKKAPGEFKEDIDKAVHAHGVTALASGIAQKEKLNRYYKGNDMILFKDAKGGSGKRIEVNLSSAVRLYQIGLVKYEEQKGILKTLRAMYEDEYLDDYSKRKQNLLNSISYMESNPRAFRHLVQVDGATITRINVHENILPLDSSFSETFEELFHYLQEEFNEGTKLLHKIRSSIENLFSEEQNIAAVFNYRPS
ncbi:DUF6792 domain-containing protein [Bacillus massilinigeriensis]|uniref:DUF6792 domain-containing protein n=1 Tax=Bacillus mediterraneensis TaxID=1805474 RepID=UPI0008F80948|nr:DUF6792 domain-containing protein [Bacillus mediterraneensis]